MISPCCNYETFRVKNKDLDCEYDVCRKCGKPWVVTEEEWTPIKGFNGYEVSTTGEVRRSKKKIKGLGGSNRCYGIKNLKQTDTPNKYKTVCLNIGGVKSTMQVHKLVADNWCSRGNISTYKYINHISGNKLDNSYLNLKWSKHEQ